MPQDLLEENKEPEVKEQSILAAIAQLKLVVNEQSRSLQAQARELQSLKSQAITFNRAFEKYPRVQGYAQTVQSLEKEVETLLLNEKRVKRKATDTLAEVYNTLMQAVSSIREVEITNLSTRLTFPFCPIWTQQREQVPAPEQLSHDTHLVQLGYSTDSSHLKFIFSDGSSTSQSLTELKTMPLGSRKIRLIDIWHAPQSNLCLGL